MAASFFTVSRTAMGLIPKSRAGAPYPWGPSLPSVVAPQGGLGASTVRETWDVGHPRYSPASAGRHGAACHPARPRHLDRLDHGPVHWA